MAVLWWFVAGILVLVELFSGTFYFLMLALGFAVGAVSAYFRTAVVAQIPIIAVACVLSTFFCYKYRKHLSGLRLSDINKNLDIGETVYVKNWQTDGHADVKHRGAIWQAKLVPGSQAYIGPYIIANVEGNFLMLEGCSS